MDDCITMVNPKTGKPSRDRTYYAFDGEGNRIGANITERVLGEAGGVSNAFGNTLSSSGNGVFRDQVGLGPWETGSVKVYQYFVTSIPGSPWIGIPTFVTTGGDDFMVFSVDVSANWVNGVKVYDVRYNGDAGMWTQDGSPRLPLCGK